jgi:hypothetical protein
MLRLKVQILSEVLFNNQKFNKMTRLTIHCLDGSKRILNLPFIKGVTKNWNHDSLTDLARELEGNNFKSIYAIFK